MSLNHSLLMFFFILSYIKCDKKICADNHYMCKCTWLIFSVFLKSRDVLFCLKENVGEVIYIYVSKIKYKYNVGWGERIVTRSLLMLRDGWGEKRDHRSLCPYFKTRPFVHTEGLLWSWKRTGQDRSNANWLRSCGSAQVIPSIQTEFTQPQRQITVIKSKQKYGPNT